MVAMLSVDSNTWILHGLRSNVFVGIIKSTRKIYGDVVLVYDRAEEITDSRITPEYFMGYISGKLLPKESLWFDLTIMFDDGDALGLQVRSRVKTSQFTSMCTLLSASGIGIHSVSSKDQIEEHKLLQLKMMALEL